MRQSNVSFESKDFKAMDNDEDKRFMDVHGIQSTESISVDQTTNDDGRFSQVGYALDDENYQCPELKPGCFKVTNNYISPKFIMDQEQFVADNTINYESEKRPAGG